MAAAAPAERSRLEMHRADPTPALARCLLTCSTAVCWLAAVLCSVCYAQQPPPGAYTVAFGTDTIDYRGQANLWNLDDLEDYFPAAHAGVIAAKEQIAQLPPVGQITTQEWVAMRDAIISNAMAEHASNFIHVVVRGGVAAVAKSRFGGLTADVMFQGIGVKLQYEDAADSGGWRWLDSVDMENRDEATMRLTTDPYRKPVNYLIRLSRPPLGSSSLTLEIASSDGSVLYGVFSFGLQAAEPGHISVQIVSGDTGSPIPARVGVYSESLFAYPDNAITMYPFDKTEQSWKETDAAWPSTFGYQRPRERCFYTRGVFDVAVRPGMVSLVVRKGLEYDMHLESFDVPAGARVTRRIALQRRFDLPSEGWFSSETHMHIRRPDDSRNDDIMALAQAMDTHVVNVLAMDNILTNQYYPQYAWGEAGMYQREDYIVYPGQEGPRTPERGHAVLLGGRTNVWSQEHYYLYEETFDACSSQGGVPGYTHGGNAPSLALSLPLHKCGFVETHMPYHGGTSDFVGLDNIYRAWSLGHRQTLISGSDFPTTNGIEDNKFYVYVEPGGAGLSYASWLASVREGRTFLSNGPILDFRVDGHGPGSSLVLPEPRTVRVELRVRMNPTLDALRKISLVSFGLELARASPATSAERQELSITYDVYASEGFWVAARAEGEKRTLAHSSPVYVFVKGRPFGRDPLRQSVIDRMQSELDSLERMIDGGIIPSAFEQAELLRDRIAQARTIYEEMRVGAWGCAFTSYGSSCGPQLSGSMLPSTSRWVTYSVSSGPAVSPGALLFGVARTQLPLGSCREILTQPLAILALTTDGSGAAHLSFPAPILLQGTIDTQFIVVDGSTLFTSQGIEASFWP